MCGRCSAFVLDEQLRCGVVARSGIHTKQTKEMTMRVTTAIGLGLALAAPARGDVKSFTAFLRKSPTPVTVPGGTTTFVLDPTAPVGSPPAAESVSVVKTSSAALPAFVAPTFTENAVLP